MNVNIGGIDRMLRIIAGVIIIALGVYYQSWWGIVGLVPLLTGVFRFCPLYTMVGVNTCKR
ncbi:YgaP family membrane protein [Psychrobacter sp.]|uniref:YgaP family membrane protein n=1 Tax=Psychrobacter sp. TaxID=56811 RepID=UPI003F9A42BE